MLCAAAALATVAELGMEAIRGTILRPSSLQLMRARLPIRVDGQDKGRAPETKGASRPEPVRASRRAMHQRRGGRARRHDHFNRSPIRAALALAIMAYLPAWPVLAQSN